MKVKELMKEMPHTIGKDISIKKAHDMMREYSIRHLPVQSGGRLVGVVSDRDVKLAASFSGNLVVEDIMSPEPYCVLESDDVGVMFSQMAKHKYGCAIVCREAKPVGIVTATDGLALLAKMLRA